MKVNSRCSAAPWAPCRGTSVSTPPPQRAAACAPAPCPSPTSPVRIGPARTHRTCSHAPSRLQLGAPLGRVGQQFAVGGGRFLASAVPSPRRTPHASRTPPTPRPSPADTRSAAAHGPIPDGRRTTVVAGVGDIDDGAVHRYQPPPAIPGTRRLPYRHRPADTLEQHQSGERARNSRSSYRACLSMLVMSERGVDSSSVRRGQVEHWFGRSLPGMVGRCGCAGGSGTVVQHRSGRGSDS